MGPEWYKLSCFINPFRRRISCLLSTEVRRLISTTKPCISKREQERLVPGSDTLLSDPEAEYTGESDGVIDNEIYYRPTAEFIAQLGYDKPNREAKYTALCSAFSKNPRILAIKRRIPPSNTVHFVKQIHKWGIEEIARDDPILNSEYYKTEAAFVNTCGQNLEFDYDIGGFVPHEGIRKSKAFCVSGVSEPFMQYGKKLRDYAAIRNAIQDGWRDCTGRNALQIMFSQAFEVCDNYREIMGLPVYEEPLRVISAGSGSQSWAGAFSCNFSILDEDFAILDWDSPVTVAQKRQYIEDSWDEFEEIASKTFIPDVQVFKLASTEYLLDMETFITVECEDVIDKPEIRQSWNQALVGLQYSKCTYALIISLYAAHLMKIEILDDGTIFTTQKKYFFEKELCNLYQSEVLVELFGDLVKILWRMNTHLK